MFQGDVLNLTTLGADMVCTGQVGRGRVMDITGGLGPAWTPPPLVTKKVRIFGHKESDLKPAVLGSPQPVHVHGTGVGLQQRTLQAQSSVDATLLMPFHVIQCHSL